MKANNHPIEQTHFWRRMDWAWLALLLCLVTLSWCSAYNRWTSHDWATPLSYGGDGWGQLTGAKAFADGEIPAILPKNPAVFGAPFRANWNDYPSVDEGLLVWTGLLARAFGVFTGINLALLSASLLAGASFYFVARQTGCHVFISVAGATLFALSRFAFARGVDHLTLTFYWHVPLGLLVVWYCLRRRSLYQDRRRFWFCIAVAVLHGIQNPYYTGMFFQFLVGTSLYHLVRKAGWPRILFPLGLAGVLCLTFLVMNLDTFYYQIANGPNPAAVQRSYADLELYALKPIELIVPLVHRLSALQDWGMNHYARQAYVVGEIGSSYLGIVGIAGLLLLVGITAVHLARQELAKISFHIWCVLWIFAYSIIGGVNGFIGLFGLILFRSSNRYSIVILACALLFLTRRLTDLTSKWKGMAISGLSVFLTILGLWDQVPLPPSHSQTIERRKLVQADAKMVRTIEARLPPGASIFELPIMDFPESPPTLGVDNMEHFRPYLYSLHLRFSYGSDKGRNRERWQREADQFGTAHLVDQLESYGFSAILINRKGYADGGAALLQELESLGKKQIVEPQREFLCFGLTPLARPVLPPEFDQAWYALEGDASHDRRWSSGNASILLFNPEAAPRRVRLSFRLETLKPRHLTISQHSQKLFDAPLESKDAEHPVELTALLQPGTNEIRFQTDRPGEPPGTADLRNLAFSLLDFKVSPE
jgi:hypothetical protein